MTDNTEEFQPTSLEVALGGEAPEPEPEPEKEPDPEPKGDEEAEKGEEPEPEKEPDPDSSEPPSQEPEGEEEPKDVAGLRAALKDERRKRQDFQKELDALKTAQQQPSQPEEPPDRDLDPEGYERWQENQRVQERFHDRVVMSQELMRSQHSDYDDVEAAFLEAMKQNPALQVQLAQHPMPAKFAYEEGKRQKFLQEIGNDPASYEQRIRADERKKAEADFKALLSKEEKAKAAELVPKSLAGASSEADRDPKNQPFEPTPLEKIIQ